MINQYYSFYLFFLFISTDKWNAGRKPSDRNPLIYNSLSILTNNFHFQFLNTKKICKTYHNHHKINFEWNNKAYLQKNKKIFKKIIYKYTENIKLYIFRYKCIHYKSDIVQIERFNSISLLNI